MSRVLRKLTAAGLTASIVIVLSVSPASALSGAYWHDDGVTLQNGVSNANVVGFWQALLLSNGGCGFTIDSIFGSATESRTKAVQDSVAFVTSDGIVGTNTWLYTQFAQYDTSIYRLQSSGGGYYFYYGGGASNANYYWDPNNGFIGDMWLWKMKATGADTSEPWYNSSASSNTTTSRAYC